MIDCEESKIQNRSLFETFVAALTTLDFRAACRQMSSTDNYQVRSSLRILSFLHENEDVSSTGCVNRCLGLSA